MNVTVDLFRESWGAKRPSLASVRARVLQMGFSHAMLQAVAGRWWLTLASEAIVDSVVMLAGSVKTKHTALILAELPVLTLMVWHDGELQRVEQRPEDALLALIEDLERQATLPLQRLQYRLTCCLPNSWQHTVDISQRVQAKPLLPLERLHQLPMFRRQQRRLLLALLALVLSLSVVMAWWLNHDAATKTEPEKALASQTLFRYLPASDALDALIDAALQPQQGAWSLTQVTIESFRLVRHFQGQPPLALLQVPEQATVIDWNQLQLQRTQPLKPENWEGDWSYQVSDLASLQHRLMAAGLPLMSVRLKNRQLMIVWQQWPLVQIKQLKQLLAGSIWHLQSASIAPDNFGWQGQLLLTIPARQLRTAS